LKSISQIIEEQSWRQPNAVAVVCGDREVTYAQLQRMANQMAAALQPAGVMPESLVGLYLERSPDLIAALLGIWKAGGAYLPIDPANPRQRVALILEDSQAAFVLTERSLLANLPPTAAKVICIEDLRDEAGSCFQQIEIAPKQLAYVIYTSGTTGMPKGAEITHDGLLNTIRAIGRDLALQPQDVVLAMATIAFDVSNLEVYIPLIAGATIHLLERQSSGDGPKLIEIIDRIKPAMALGTPTLWRLILDAGWQGSPNLRIISGGEVLPLALGKRLAEITRAVWNQYGPTETSICATRDLILPDAEIITLGMPIENVHFYILDENLSHVRSGDTGEVYIGGAGVGRGYRCHPELTAKAFFPDPFDLQPGARMYKTGDLGRLLPDGRLDFQGRIDNQIKLRGFRVELEEIEAAIREYRGIHTACVQLVEHAPNDQRLVAYFLGDALVTSAPLRDFLRHRLPAYMVPSELIPLESVPMTINGKIDRKALDAIRIQLESRDARTPQVAGHSIKATLKEIWQRLLKVRAIGPSDNFFDLGGHSLLAARMFAEVERATGRKIPLSVLIENPTLAQLAACINNYPRCEWPGLIPLEVRAGGSPLFIAHGLGSNLLLFRELAQELGPTHPVYGIQLVAPQNADLNELELEAFAARYVRAIQRVDPVGPYNLAGHSLGGLLAFEIASQLKAAGKEIGLLALLDSNFRGSQSENPPAREPVALRDAIRHWEKKLSRFRAGGMVNMARRKVEYNKLMFKVWALRKTYRDGSYYPRIFGLDPYIALFAENYKPQPIEADVTLFAAEDELSPESVSRGWSRVIGGRLELQKIPGSHQTIFTRPQVSILAQEVRKRLARSGNIDASRAALDQPGYAGVGI
jgi:amino acid adenylation domain-containing protein